jgi:MFS family permease
VAGWRWCFYVNLPLSLLALFMLLVKMPALTHRRPGKIDFIGAGLIIITFTPLLLALGWAGRDYAWGSPVIVGLFALSAIGLATFVVAERFASNPILDLHLLANRVFLTANSAGFVTSMAFMGTVTFLPLYMQLGQGVPATVSGLSMLPLMMGLIASSTVCGLLVTKTGRYKPFLLMGTGFMCLGALLLTQITPTTSTPDILWRMLVLGIGLGPMQSLFSLAVQNAVKPQEIGVATSASQFFRQIGSTIGVALFGAVLTQNLAMAAARAPHAPGTAVRALTLSDLERMAVAQAAGVKAGGGHGVAAHVGHGLLAMAGRIIVTDAIRGVVFTALAVSAIGLLLTSLVPELPLRSRHPAAGRDSEAESEAALAPAHT